MRADTAVFVGPSLAGDAVRRVLPHARLEPPAGRGDITRLRSEGVRTFLFIDGAFAHRLAVSPREILDALADGCRMMGAASLGAIRAAECRPAGMAGIGAIYQLYRWRVISSDDEVAVATEPDRGYRASSVALINVRFAMLAALRRGFLARRQAEAVLASAKGMYFSERTWPAIFAGAGLTPDSSLRELCQATDVKRRDAELAVARLAKGAVTADRRPPLPASPTACRYPGHDPLLGATREELEPVLTRWLLATGRADRYRPSAGQALWDVLAAEHELEPELMRWYAASRAG